MLSELGKVLHHKFNTEILGEVSCLILQKDLRISSNETQSLCCLRKNKYISNDSLKTNTAAQHMP